MGVLLARAGGVILGICERAEGAAVSSVNSGSTSGQSGHLRVRDLLRLYGASRDCCERAGLMARLAVELNNAASDIAADPARVQQYREVIARLRGQADMARLAGVECTEHDRERSRAC